MNQHKKGGAKLYQDFVDPGCSANLACCRLSVVGKERKKESDTEENWESKAGLGYFDKQDSGNPPKKTVLTSIPMCKRFFMERAPKL